MVKDLFNFIVLQYDEIEEVSSVELVTNFKFVKRICCLKNVTYNILEKGLGLQLAVRRKTLKGQKNELIIL